MAGKAEDSIQKHILATRFAALDSLPNPNKEGYDAQSGRGWRFVNDAGLLRFEFCPTIGWGELRDISRRGKAASIASGFPDTRQAITGVPVLSNTSKMGCFSFSLNAGPPQLLGTCPAAVLAFRFRDGSRSVTFVDRAGTEHSKTVSRDEQIMLRRQLVGSELPDAKAFEHTFICNGCYAFKNLYGSPLNILPQLWRTMWCRAAVRNGTFGPVMVTAIDMALKLARKQMAAATDDVTLGAACSPDFFRIHDSGDIWGPAYFQAWCDIARVFPKVTFWMPTRCWANPRFHRAIASIEVPTNLIVRPSSLWFDDPPPEVVGMDAGSTSAAIRLKPVGDDITVMSEDVGPDVWMCPAYLPTMMGGGALRRLHRNPETFGPQRFKRLPPLFGTKPLDGYEWYEAQVGSDGHFLLDDKGRPLHADNDTPHASRAWAQAFLPAGACQLALGPDGSRPCRVCWNMPKSGRGMKVSYAKH